MIELSIELVDGVVVSFQPTTLQITMGEVRSNDFDITITEIQKLSATPPYLHAGEMTRRRKLTLPIADLSAFTGYNTFDTVKLNEILGRFGRKLQD